MRGTVPAICLALAALLTAGEPALADPPPASPTYARTLGDCASSALPFGTGLSEPQLRDRLWDLRLQLQARCLYDASERWVVTDRIRAVQLFALATLRRRYDVFRCRGHDPTPALLDYAGLQTDAAAVLGALSATEAQAHREAYAALIDDPRTFEYPPVELAGLCRNNGGVAEVVEWPVLKDRLVEAYREALGLDQSGAGGANQ